MKSKLLAIALVSCFAVAGCNKGSDETAAPAGEATNVEMAPTESSMHNAPVDHQMTTTTTTTAPADAAASAPVAPAAESTSTTSTTTTAAPARDMHDHSATTSTTTTQQ